MIYQICTQIQKQKGKKGVAVIKMVEINKEVNKTVFPAVKESDLKILCELRKNSRQTLAEISRATGVSISTIYDRIKFHEEQLIKKHTSLINFQLLGYGLRVTILIAAQNKQKLKEFIKSHQNINSAFEINNEYNFILDCVFANMSECHDFEEECDKLGVEKKQVHYIVDEIKSEAFMAKDEEGI